MVFLVKVLWKVVSLIVFMVGGLKLSSLWLFLLLGLCDVDVMGICMWIGGLMGGVSVIVMRWLLLLLMRIGLFI